jgi:hypothetical protein
MISEAPAPLRRLNTKTLSADLAVVGGGLAGVCAAITAAREGARVILVHDRPVLGGNASSEVRLWVLGATSHMGNNNRWAREGGVIDEILSENLWRNPEGNAVIFDTVVLDKVAAEPNITLLLNSVACEVEKADADTIRSVRAVCSQNSTIYGIDSPLFCDASGDGILGFLSGAAFRMGAEFSSEFGEKFAPDREYGELLGHSLYFYSKDVGRPVRFTPPSFALKDITKIPRFRSFNANDYGCKLWWIEYGGRMDTVHDTETVKWELWKIVYGVWNYIKNSGKFPEAENLTLEWVGHIPGKRESRRFEGPCMLRQQDIIEQREHEDAVAFGGWSIDLHPADGVFSEKPGCNQWHARGIYQIPYRCYFSRNIRNLFLAGRIVSASHVAFGSSRVMGTCAHGAQAVGMAAAICREQKCLPAEILEPPRLRELQIRLQRSGQHIPNVVLQDEDNLALHAKIDVSSTLQLQELPADGPWLGLECAVAQMLPAPAGTFPAVTLFVRADEPTVLAAELRTSDRPCNHTPDVLLAQRSLEISGESFVHLDFDAEIDQPRYVFVCLASNPKIHVKTSQMRLTGILTVYNAFNSAVATSSRQTPSEDIGVESFEFWCPRRRPEGHNFAFRLSRPLDAYNPGQLGNGWLRPTFATNAWAPAMEDSRPSVRLTWAVPQRIRRFVLFFDPDYDHPMESVLMPHPERVVPFCVKSFRLKLADGTTIASIEDNHLGKVTISLEQPVVSDQVILEILETNGAPCGAVFAIQCFES